MQTQDFAGAWQVLREQRNLTPSQDESLIPVVIEAWLIQRNPSADAFASMRYFAGELRINHGDNWLSDFLNAPSSPDGNKLLRAAIDANHAGHADRGLHAASRARAEYLRRKNMAGVLRSDFELVYALRRLARSKECINQASAAARNASELNYAWVDIQVTIEQGSCEGMRSDPDAAHILAQRAHDAAVAARYTNLDLRTLGLFGNLAMAEGNTEGTWANDEEGLRLFWEGMYPDDRGFQFYYNLQVDSERNREVHLAALLQREVLEMISGRSRFDYEGMAHSRMASAAAAAGDRNTALQEIDAYRSVLAKIPPSSGRAIYEAYCEIGLARLAMQSASMLDAQQHLDKARPVAAYSKNLLLRLDYLTTSAQLDRTGADPGAERRDLQGIVAIAARGFANLKSPVDRWRWRQIVEASYRRLLEVEVSRPHSAPHAFAYWESVKRSESAPALDAAINPETADLESFTQARLVGLRGSTLISFAVLPDRLVAWVADDGGVREFALPVKLPDLRREVQLFYSLCSNDKSDLAKVNDSGSRLYKLLIGPLEPALDPGRVWAIEPDGFLSMIPWSALRIGDGSYLGLARTVTIYGGLFANPGSPRSAHAVKTVLAANPESVTLDGRVFPALLHAEAEVAELEHLYHNTVPLRGTDVTVAKVLRHLPGVDLFEFAGHAVSRNHGGELVLHSNDGRGAILTATSVEKLRLTHTELVVLGACSTAAETDSDRDPNGLVRAFLNAGAAQVLAGRWDLDSGATAELMNEFHGLFKSGLSAVKSLQQARRALASGDRFAHPYYWAGIEVFSAKLKGDKKDGY